MRRDGLDVGLNPAPPLESEPAIVITFLIQNTSISSKVEYTYPPNREFIDMKFRRSKTPTSW
jgi:hypothetical protein